MIFMVVAFLFPTKPAPPAQNMNYTVIVLGGVITLSLTYYFFPVYGGRHWFIGPVETIEDRDNNRGEQFRKIGDKSGLH